MLRETPPPTCNLQCRGRHGLYFRNWFVFLSDAGPKCGPNFGSVRRVQNQARFLSIAKSRAQNQVHFLSPERAPKLNHSGAKKRFRFVFFVSVFGPAVNFLTVRLQLAAAFLARFRGPHSGPQGCDSDRHCFASYCSCYCGAFLGRTEKRSRSGPLSRT